MRVLDERTIGFADFSGNRQYVSTGNFRADNRVALFFMDYPNRTRLKLLGRIREIPLENADELARLEVDNYRARVERGFVIEIEGFDWNCPQHITPRFTEEQVAELMAPLLEEKRALETAAQNSYSASPESLGDGPLSLVISGVRQLTPRVRAYELRERSGAELPQIEAGAHLRVPVQMEGGAVEFRRYSICSNPARRGIYEIAVLREDQGLGGSRALHGQYRLGRELRCEAPSNHFPLHRGHAPALLIAGGIGITPIKSMAQALQTRGTALEIHYAGRSEVEMAFSDRLVRQFGRSIVLYRSNEGERMALQQLLSEAAPKTNIYVCGPEGLLAEVMKASKRVGIEPERLHFERFAPPSLPEARPLKVTLQRSQRALAVAADQSVLDAVLESGVPAKFGCKTGSCGACAVALIAGTPDHRDEVLTADEKSRGMFCPCVSRAQGEELVLDL